MIDEKFIELMNRDIDNLITPGEKTKLYKYLTENADSREYYDELKFTSDSLDLLHAPEPSVNLKKKIINSINFDKYLPETERSSPRNSGWLFKFKYAYTFAAGLIAGLFIYSLININSTNVGTDEISGTIGANSNAVTIEEIPLNYPGMNGNILIQEHGTNFWFKINSNSSLPVDFTISYPEQVQFENIKPEKSVDLHLSGGTNYIKITNNGSQQYTVMFTKNHSPESPVLFKLSQSGNKIYECELNLKR